MVERHRLTHRPRHLSSLPSSLFSKACLLLINIRGTARPPDSLPGWAVSGIWASVCCLGLVVLRKEWPGVASSLALLAPPPSRV